MRLLRHALLGLVAIATVCLVLVAFQRGAGTAAYLVALLVAFAALMGGVVVMARTFGQRPARHRVREG